MMTNIFFLAELIISQHFMLISIIFLSMIEHQ